MPSLLIHPQPLIAACDTFRAGAVEQLKQHCSKLGVELFEKGYERDPAGVAIAAVRYAKENDMDVVLVDTAGRMQVCRLCVCVVVRI